MASKSGVQARRSVSPIGFKPKRGPAATNCGPVRPSLGQGLDRTPRSGLLERAPHQLVADTLFRLAGAFSCELLTSFQFSSRRQR